LNAVAFAQGSLKVQVEVDDHDLFARVAGLYRGMTRATYNENRIAETFSRLPRTVAENYQQYLSTLNVNKLEVFAEWREGKEERSAFVGYAGAQRTRKAFRTIIQTTGVQRWTDTLTGYFEGFGRKPRHFEFYDEKTGNRVSGSITKALRDTPIAGELYLGRRLKYRVEIEHVKSGDKTKSTLLNFARTDD
ncbi:hypothetical protein, partial [Candidatus Binatus sp.]|uniref:hypothetical protein n=1 Tax=Candidatus Binatus sp. TaxID=2811406 RepID=UPI003CC62F4C